MTRALVTGGGGFLGAALARALLRRGWAVRAFARGDYPELRAEGAETARGDVRDRGALARACDGVDVVFHTAAKAGSWGDPAEYEAINVAGTENVVAACRAARVPVLVHTSSPSVVHASRAIEGEDESLPYATRFPAAYPRTKAAAEKVVLAAAAATLRTVALRPHFIWGPGDNHLLPRLLARAERGRLRRIGAGDPLVDTNFIDNCVAAHVLAAERLMASASPSGKAYFVSDGPPIGVFTMASRMLECAGRPPVTKAIPAKVAMTVAAALEATHAVLRLDREPLLTRFAVTQLTHPQWFDTGAARRDLGYEPVVTRERGFELLAAHFRGSSKSSARVLGGGA